MKKRLKILFCCAAAALAVSAALAHGGMQRSAGSVVVTLYQTPLSPFVGEPVTMTFALTGADGAALFDHEVKLTLTDTFTGDASKDRVILEKTYQTDANGDFEFEYSFPNPDYFDVDLAFLDPVTGHEEEAGFLVQPRLMKSPAVPLALASEGGFFAGLAVAWTVRQLGRRRHAIRKEGS